VSGSGSATPDEEDIVDGSELVGTRSCQRHVLRENYEEKSKRKTPRIEIEDDPTFDGIPRERCRLPAAAEIWRQKYSR